MKSPKSTKRHQELSLLEELVSKKGYELRYDKITGFRFDGAVGSYGNKNVVVVDKLLPVGEKISTLCEILRKIGLEDTFIPPILNRYFER